MIVSSYIYFHMLKRHVNDGAILFAHSFNKRICILSGPETLLGSRLYRNWNTSFGSKTMSLIISSENDVMVIGLSSLSFKKTELKYSLNMSAACLDVLENKRGISASFVGMETCCGIRLDLVDVLKKDQNSFGFCCTKLLDTLFTQNSPFTKIYFALYRVRIPKPMLLSFTLNPIHQKVICPDNSPIVI